MLPLCNHPALFVYSCIGAVGIFFINEWVYRAKKHDVINILQFSTAVTRDKTLELANFAAKLALHGPQLKHLLIYWCSDGAIMKAAFHLHVVRRYNLQYQVLNSYTVGEITRQEQYTYADR